MRLRRRGSKAPAQPQADPATQVQPDAQQAAAAQQPAADGAKPAAPAAQGSEQPQPAAPAAQPTSVSEATQATPGPQPDASPAPTPAPAPSPQSPSPAQPAAAAAAGAQSPSAPQAAGPARSPSAPGAQPAITPRPQPGPITGTGRTVAVAARETPEGLRGWVAQLDRKLGVRTYVGLAVVVLALATSVVAIVLAIDARDNSARNQDLNELSDQVAAASTAAQTTEDDLTALEARVQALEDGTAGTTGTGSTSGLEKRLQVVESDIQELQGQIQELQGGKSGSKP